MEKQTIDANTTFATAEERTRLVHFCARITNNKDAAEDLAQETLLVAWQNTHMLRDTQRHSAWLFGIARNLCLRWLRTHRRDAAHLIQPYPNQDLFEINGDETGLADLLADDLDIELALEQKELIELLNHALSLLPAETRTALIQHYIGSSPLAEIATQLSTNTSAVAMRLQRGKLALRRILAKEVGQDIPFSGAHTSTEHWEITPLWCHICGQRRLLGQRDPSEGKLILKCPTCNLGADAVQNSNHLLLLKGVKGYKPLYTRLAAWCDRYYRTALRNSSITCIQCGHIAPASIQTPEHFPQWFRNKKEMDTWMQYPDDRVVTIMCEYCCSSSITSLESLVLETAQGQYFLQAHPRIRTLPRQYLETAGRAAILTRFESITDAAKLDIISDDQTYELLHVYGEDL